ncbi:MAG TPA: hypothetical protein VHW60_10145 [Caulobacteraceae bacterium]|jgi:hypothetical protein|nr:hypothetical protein [Caulobacteraceae bacterium]
MTPSAASSALTEARLAEVRGRPQFRGACERFGRGALEHFAHLAPLHQWVTKDLGRGSITLTALILQLRGDLTMQALTTACVGQGVSSPGRVTQLVRRAQDAGEVTVDDGPGIWTRRPLRMGPVFLQSARSRLIVDIESMLMLWPELAPVREVIADDVGYLNFVLVIGFIISRRRDIFGLSARPPLNIFLNREAGIHILLELMTAQAPDRVRLLEEARISRNALSHRYDVSRAHVNKLLADSGHTRADGDRVVFTPELSDSLERHMSLIFSLTHLVSQCLLDGWRFG